MANSCIIIRAKNLVNFVQNGVKCNSYYLRNYRSNLRTSFNLCRQYANEACKGRLYSKKHEWVDVDGNIGTIGISHYAQEALGDVVFAQLPEIGQDVERDQEVGALESVKAASEIYSPVSGNVCGVNKDVEQTPGLINQSCYDKGWLFKLTLVKMEELDDLMNEKQYQEFLKMEQSSDS